VILPRCRQLLIKQTLKKEQTTHNGTRWKQAYQFCAKEGWKMKDLDDYYASHTTLSCGQVGQEIKNCFKGKLRTSPTILGGWLGQSLTQGVGN
jgi:hypothetical protein